MIFILIFLVIIPIILWLIRYDRIKKFAETARSGEEKQLIMEYARKNIRRIFYLILFGIAAAVFFLLIPL